MFGTFRNKSFSFIENMMRFNSQIWEYQLAQVFEIERINSEYWRPLYFEGAKE